ncbi:MAG: phosphate ABC transporter substrate-binding/OmpA family protein [Candidatus Thiodiazotropha sp. (ex Lucinoma borealis)]|nr:phosphate ABC transporter substrate-binding/OmpA family protein [Candidatus Thiodiazotropha sp. (ex Lucinoma borealis)]MCU7856783.1 phosphate ABC transporter substrate-binding/OmpA family protein [Candidatus Thiodiazotropha sp. (ex Lucinoma borealis)]
MNYRHLTAAILLMSVIFNTQADSLQLRIHGSNTLGSQLVPELIHSWLENKGYSQAKMEKGKELAKIQAESRDGSRIEVLIESKGSSTGFKGLQQGSADLGMSSRRIKKQEITVLSSMGDMTSVENESVVALDGIAVIVHPDNPLTKLSKSQIRDIFAGSISDWEKVGGLPGSIHLYARDNQSGTYQVFNSLVLGKKTSLSNKAKRFTDNTELSREVSNDTLGIGFVSMPNILDSKALAISDGEAPAIVPNRFSVATEDYSLSRRLYIYAPKQASANPLALDFMNYIQSDSAQNIVSQVGFVTQQIFTSTDEPGKHYPQAMRELVVGATRLSVNMRFDERTVFLDSKAKRDADRVYSYLSETDKLKDGVMLFGFAENKPDGVRNISFNRSIRRADQVAKYLSKKGVSVATSRGYGGTAPVASNETTLGQQKNRRVELWIK